MGSSRNRPSNIVNTPMGPRRKSRLAGERMRADQERRPFFAPPRDINKDKRLSGEESRDVFGQDFTESVKETEKTRPERSQTGFFSAGGFRKNPEPRPTRPRPPMGGPGINRNFSGFGGMRQVTKIDEFGQKYGGVEKYNPETGKFEAQYTKPPRPAPGEVVSRRIPKRPTKGERGHSRPPSQRP